MCPIAVIYLPAHCRVSDPPLQKSNEAGFLSTTREKCSRHDIDENSLIISHSLAQFDYYSYYRYRKLNLQTGNTHETY